MILCYSYFQKKKNVSKLKNKFDQEIENNITKYMNTKINGVIDHIKKLKNMIL